MLLYAVRIYDVLNNAVGVFVVTFLHDVKAVYYQGQHYELPANIIA